MASDATDNGLDVGDLFQDPEGYYQEKEPTYAEHKLLSGLNLRVRLVGSHPLYGNLLWNAGRISAEYLEQNAAQLVQGKDILELGAAAGVPSIVCAINGARTVVMTDYSDPDLVQNMKENAASAYAAGLIPPNSHLHVAGYKWGAATDDLLSYLPGGNGSEKANNHHDEQGFDVLIMADVVYSHREHGNLILTMHRTLKKSPEAVALVIFTPYQPWLLPKTEKFFPLAEENGFTVRKLFEKTMDKVLFEEDPGDEKLRRTVFGYELRWAPNQLSDKKTPTPL